MQVTEDQASRAIAIIMAFHGLGVAAEYRTTPKTSREIYELGEEIMKSQPSDERQDT